MRQTSSRIREIRRYAPSVFHVSSPQRWLQSNPTQNHVGIRVRPPDSYPSPPCKSYSSSALAAPEETEVRAVSGCGNLALKSLARDLIENADRNPDHDRFSRYPLDEDGSWVPKLNSFGKWHHLSLQPRRLLAESSLTDSPLGKPVKLVDLPENSNDVFLWACLLEFRRRRYGSPGVSDIMTGLLARRTLFEVESSIAKSFWRTIHYEALGDEKMMGQVWEYAEWMWERHGVRWPNLYHDWITSSIQSGRFSRALRWNIQLSPNFGLDAQGFSRMLKRFIGNPNSRMQHALKTLYWTSTHRSLHDDLVSHLYGRGNLYLAHQWRRFLLRFYDLPQTDATQPLLHSLAGYSLENISTETDVSNAELDTHDPEPDPLEEHDSRMEQVNRLRYTMNRIHGQTFGIKEKTYNDSLLARLFASSWVSLDMAIDVVRMFGVDRIGPLSLQALALREGNAGRLVSRLAQLEKANIDVGDSCYAKVVRHWARSKDEENLQALLHSDIHPDVFDDEQALERILRSAFAVGDLRLQCLILSVQTATFTETIILASNQLLCLYLTNGRHQSVLQMLRDMAGRDVQILPSTSNTITLHILENVSPFPGLWVDLWFVTVLCYHLAGMRFPLATMAYNQVLCRLAREGKLEEMERLALKIAKSYQDVRRSEHAMLYVHQFDAPAILRKNSDDFFQPVPRDLDLTNPRHPIHLIFNAEFQRTLVRQGFRRSLFTPRRERSNEKVPHAPADFGFARGLRLLAMLRKYGLRPHSYLIQRWVCYWLSQLYGTIGRGQRPNRVIKALRHANQLNLSQAKDLCDDAWGSEIVPQLPHLRARIRRHQGVTSARAAWNNGR